MILGNNSKTVFRTPDVHLKFLFHFCRWILDLVLCLSARDRSKIGYK